jgi:hypothetical protein
MQLLLQVKARFEKVSGSFPLNSLGYEMTFLGEALLKPGWDGPQLLYRGDLMTHPVNACNALLSRPSRPCLISSFFWGAA